MPLRLYRTFQRQAEAHTWPEKGLEMLNKVRSMFRTTQKRLDKGLQRVNKVRKRLRTASKGQTRLEKGLRIWTSGKMTKSFSIFHVSDL